MRILYINSVCSIGSTGRIVEDLAKRDILEGHQVLIAYGRGNAQVDGAQMYKIGSPISLALHGVESRLFDNHGFGSRNATRKFIKIIKNFNPDMIWIHNLHGYYINIEQLFEYLKESRVLVKWTLHDCWPFTGHCSFAGEEIGCDKWKYKCSKCHMTKYYPSCILFDRSSRNYEKKKRIFTGVKNLTLVTPSQWLADMTRKSFLKDYPVNVVRNKIDLSCFKPVLSSFKSDFHISEKFVLLCVGFSWDCWKISDMITISNSLMEDEVLIVVGMTYRQSRHLSKGTIVIQRTNSKQELAKIYSAADVFINPTYSDNYPTVNLESEACGTPVICYNTGGSYETISMRKSTCVPKGNIVSLLNQARRLKDI